MDKEELEIDPEQIPTKELLKRLRAKDYKKAKDLRREQKKQQNAAKKRQKEEDRAKRDKELWEGLSKAADLEK